MRYHISKTLNYYINSYVIIHHLINIMYLKKFHFGEMCVNCHYRTTFIPFSKKNIFVT